MWHGRALLSEVAGTSPAMTLNSNTFYTVASRPAARLCAGTRETRRHAPDLHHRRTIALAAAADVLVHGADPDDAVVAVPVAVLLLAARRPAGRARGRPRVPARQLFRAPARVLARRHRLCRRRRHRGLPAGAGLRARHAVGGIHARARSRGHSSRCLRGAADGRHLRVLGADAELRPGKCWRCRSSRCRF